MFCWYKVWVSVNYIHDTHTHTRIYLLRHHLIFSINSHTNVYGTQEDKIAELVYAKAGRFTRKRRTTNNKYYCVCVVLYIKQLTWNPSICVCVYDKQINFPLLYTRRVTFVANGKCNIMTTTYKYNHHAYLPYFLLFNIYRLLP